MAEGDQSAQATVAGTQAQHFREASDKIRQRTDLTAKTLGGLATTGLTAIGIAKITDVFPWAPHQGWIVGVMLLGFIAMAIAVGALTFRLWRISGPLVLKSDLNEMGLSDQELAETRPIYKRFATINLAPSVRALEARVFRWQRIAEWLEEHGATKLLKRSDALTAEIVAVENRVGMIVVRRRASRAFADGWALLAYLVFFAGVLTFGLAADHLESERTKRVEIQKACADARAANATDLPSICGSASKTEETGATPAEESAQGIASLGTALSNCVSAAEKAKAPPASCEPLRRALAAASSEPIR